MPQLSRQTGSSLADINIVPFVDVMLVLLIIFMITAPILQSGIEVDLPKTQTVKEISQDRLVVTVDRSQLVYLGNDAVNIHDLGDEGALADARSASGRGVSALRRDSALRHVRNRNRHASPVRHHKCKHRDGTVERAPRHAVTNRAT